MGASRPPTKTLSDDNKFDFTVKKKFFLKRSKFIDGAHGVAQPKILPEEP